MNDNNADLKKVEGIDDEFQDIALRLKKVDFSKDSNEKKIYGKLIKNIEKSDSMKRLSILKKCSVAAAIVVASGVFISQSTYAKEAVSAIINKVSLGSITIYQENEEGKDIDDYRVLYDKDGNEVDKETIEKGGVFYSKNGDEIKIQAKDDNYKVDILAITDINKIKDYACFDVKMPSYLPEGYKFKQVEFFKDENGEVKDSKYANLVYVNEETGEKFEIDERQDCEETRFEMSTDEKVEKIQINGVDAALTNDKDIDWVNDGNIYSLLGRNLSRSEVVKVAESIK